jgi:hypothetical protein
MFSTIRIVALVAFIFMLGSALALRIYRLDLIEIVVTNALIQKAPESVSAEQLREELNQARTRAERQGEEEAYLNLLLRKSQRLEKIQSVTEGEMLEILEEFRQIGRGRL